MLTIYRRPVAAERIASNVCIDILCDSHNISDFASSDPDLTEYFVEDAINEQRNRTSTTHVLLDNNETIVGYFTLLNDSIKVVNLEDRHIDGCEYSSVPAVKIGRLSTHRDHEHKGYGSLMLTLAMSYVFEVQRYSGCRVVTVDSKKGCEGFYEHFGFKKTSIKRDNSTPMYLDISKFLEDMASQEQHKSNAEDASSD
jgi:predicted GNAT family N-acyltransferase